MGVVTGSSKRLRVAMAGIAAGVVVGGTVAVVAPAVATQDTSYAATNWKKVWKNNLQQYADKRYYTKKKSDKRYYTKKDSDAKYAAVGSSYTKAESDAKYAPYPKTIRGTYIVQDNAAAAGEFTFTDISFGWTLAAAPTVVFMPLGGPANPNCTGNAATPQAAPGFLCVYEGLAAPYTGPLFATSTGGVGLASTTGVVMRIASTGAGSYASLGAWAVTASGAVGATAAEHQAAKPGNERFLRN